MNTEKNEISLSGFGCGLAAIFLIAHPSDVLARGSFGTKLDTQCASLAVSAAPPQQSRPYRASGSSCSLCHTSSNPSLNDLNALGEASRAANVAAMNPFCINTAPRTAIISAPAADGTSAAPGGSVTFTGSSSDPDGFTLTYRWNFSNGTVLTGQSVAFSVPAGTSAGIITATLAVTDPDGASAANQPTRTLTVTSPTPTSTPLPTPTPAPSSTPLPTSTPTPTPNPGAPVANADEYRVESGGKLSIAAPGVLANDTGNGRLSARIVTGPKNAGSFSFAETGAFSYTPKKDFGGLDSFTYRVYAGKKSSAPATVTIRIIKPCLDRDGDGFSPEGKSCGPVDCNDSDGKVTVCTASNTCIDKLLVGQVRIDSAAWEDAELIVTGSKAIKGMTVRVYDAVTNRLLGTVKVGDKGAWRLKKELARAPCRIRAEINGQGGQRNVDGAPSSCLIDHASSCDADDEHREHEDD